jgi:serine protease AprX
LRQVEEGDVKVRSSALWGKGGRGFAVTLVLALALSVPVVATADSDAERLAYASPGLLEAAQADPAGSFDVIVQGNGRTNAVAAAVRSTLGKRGKGIRKQYDLISGVAARLTGRQIVRLARHPGITAITADVPLALAAYSNKQRWPYVSGVQKFWAASAMSGLGKRPAIAIVDSGIDKNRVDFDFGARVLDVQVLTQLQPNSNGDGRGHGTFVAGIAAGSGPNYAGASPQANIVSLDVMDDNGMAMTRDVISAAEWIYENRESRNIRVANFSLHSSSANSFMFDPLDRAVEKLWFGGVVVVVAAGNYGVGGQPSGVPYAPGNDPFVITVGADDVDGSVSTNDDYAAPWSAYGYTLDGFAKPEVSAPGRFMVGPASATSTLALERPGSVVAPGYIQLSGTSFAAPIVAGAAAEILAAHPDWSPDQVKGALMLTARPASGAAPLSTGVGVIDAAKAVAVTNPPNPNLALNAFLVADPNDESTPAFDAASWANAAWANASWANASWANASWANASWSSASWANASWANASWASASWANSSEGAASWANASWASFSFADNAEGDVTDEGGEWVDPAELEALGAVSSEPLADPETALP